MVSKQFEDYLAGMTTPGADVVRAFWCNLAALHPNICEPAVYSPFKIENSEEYDSHCYMFVWDIGDTYLDILVDIECRNYDWFYRQSANANTPYSFDGSLNNIPIGCDLPVVLRSYLKMVGATVG